MNKTALITGASGGLGKALSIIHAQNGGDLIVVSRNKEKLNTLKELIESKFETSVHVIVADLSEHGAAKKVYDEVSKKGIQVDYLINNAGFGGQGYFAERDWEQDLSMIQVNIVALTELTRYFLPEMIERQEGKILNISSSAALLPGPLQAVYYASKAYVLSFSNALYEEVRNDNISVTALLPGAVDTEFAKTSGMENTKLFKKAVSPTKVAKQGYNAMIQGKMNQVAGFSLPNRILLSTIRFMPRKLVLKSVHKAQTVEVIEKPENINIDSSVNVVEEP